MRYLKIRNQVLDPTNKFGFMFTDSDIINREKGYGRKLIL